MRVLLLLNKTGAFELVVERSVGGHLVGAEPAVLNQHPREVLTGHFPVGDRTTTVARIRLGSVGAGLRRRVVDLHAGKKSLAAGVYIVRVNELTPAGRLRERGSSIIVRLKPDGRFVDLLEPHTSPAPSASTGGASSITQSTAIVTGEVESGGQTTRYHFEYGRTPTYGAQTTSESGGSKRTSVGVSANLTGLSAATTYHYRLVASDCAECRLGTSYGADHTFTTFAATALTPQQMNADRALATYNAMQQHFYAANVYPGDTSGLYVTDYPQSGNAYSYLWPFSRALVGTITLSGIPPALLGGASYQADVDDRLTGLSRYWDSTSTGPGYDSYPTAPYGHGGDKYYDDQAWVGLALAQNYHMTGNQNSLVDAENVFNFIYPGGWASTSSFEPGGIYWVQQGVGAGLTNHDRTTNSTVPDAELALLLDSSDPANAAKYDLGASEMYGWANHYLYNVNINPTDPNAPNPNFNPDQPALMSDKLRGNNTIDETLWTYNQGAMIAANVREYRKTGQSTYLSNAESIASAAISTFTESDYLNNQPAAFNAIFFRGLLVLYSATRNTTLRSKITQTIQTYADDAWNNDRSPQGLFRFPSSSGTGYQLLDQGAMLQIYAALAWNPGDYPNLP